MNITQAVAFTHNQIVHEMHLPSWADKIKCPYCSIIMKKTSIRGITLKLNPSNIQDVVVEFLCDGCKCGDYLYLRKKADSAESMAAILNNDTPINVDDFITEKEMHELRYNNSMDRIAEKEMFFRKVREEIEKTEGLTKEQKIDEIIRINKNAATIPINWESRTRD